MLKQRVLTAVALLAVLYVGTAWLSPLYFGVFLGLISIPALLEWAGLMGLKQWPQKVAWISVFLICLATSLWLLRVSPEDFGGVGMAVVSGVALLYWLWIFWLIRDFPRGQQCWGTPWKMGLMGIATLLPTWLGLFSLKLLSPSGVLIFILIALVSVVDIGAYFAGTAFGRNKLAPALSPGKSWAGFWGGLTSSVVLSTGLLLWVHLGHQPLSIQLWVLLLVLSLMLAVFSVIGDLFESMLKRHRGLKDSGRSLPGHGGILDRIDSLVAATPVYVLALLILSADLDVI